MGGGQRRQITFEKDPDEVMGVPVWSPDGKLITFATSRASNDVRTVGYQLVHPDGSGLHLLIPLGTWAAWSGDSKWLYYSESSPVHATGSFRLMKIPADGGTPVLVRSDNARGPAPSPDGSALYYAVPLQNLNGSLDYELRVARPENGPSSLLARISGQRLPLWQGFHPVISRNGKWLVMPLDDSLGTNIWVASTADGKLRQITDFGQKRTFIARRISWSSDDKSVFAAVGEGDADIVQLDQTPAIGHFGIRLRPEIQNHQILIHVSVANFQGPSFAAVHLESQGLVQAPSVSIVAAHCQRHLFDARK